MNKIKVLYIDDEESNLNAFKASFRRDFDIKLANSSFEAVEILENTPIEIIISDQKMPKITGVEFFESIIDKYPNAIRILLTGFSDIDAVINAINKGKVYSYVTKPWNDFDLRQMIQNAHNYYVLKRENQNLNRRYQKVFQNSSDLILIFNEEGQIIDSNGAAENVLKVNSESNLTDFIKDKLDLDYINSELKNNKSISDFECDFVSDNGKVINGIISASSLYNIHDESKYFQIIFKDITERKLSDKQIFKKIIEAQENERRRVADDLHDSLGQELSSVKMMVGVLKDGNLKADKQLEITQQCHQILEDSISDLRNICFDLMPSALERGGFIPAFKQLIQPLFIEVEMDITEQELPLNIEQQTALYRVSQEFVNNTLKHSQASKIKLIVDLVKENQVNVIFEDNGIGFNIDEHLMKRGRGQNTMLKRMESYGGKSILESKKGEGTKLKITFECQKK